MQIVNIFMNSAKTARIRNLQTAAQAKLFLEELVNLREEPEACARFWERCSSFFPQNAFRVEEDTEEVWPLLGIQLDQAAEVRSGIPGRWVGSKPLTPERKSELRRVILLRMRDELRKAWEIADLRRKEWKLFLLREKFHQMSAAAAEQMTEPPPPSGMDFALRYFLRVIHKARQCENPECDARRFFISDRRTRRFCSDACAKPAQSEYKSKWWEENRDRIREARKRKYRENKKRKREKGQ